MSSAKWRQFILGLNVLIMPGKAYNELARKIWAQSNQRVVWKARKLFELSEAEVQHSVIKS